MPKKDQVEEVTLEAVKLGTVRLKITGQTPLLCSRINAETEKILDKKGKATSQSVPEERKITDLAYTNSRGEWVFPAAGIKKALVHAARLTPMQMTQVRAMINVMASEVIITGSEPSIVVHTARKDGKALVRAQRAEFPTPWEMEFTVSYVVGTIAPTTVIALASMAGFGVGLGCWRPENNGTYGQFSVVATY